MASELGKINDLSEQEKATLFKQVGYGALKYFLLKVSPQKSMMFDPAASVDFIGNTGPFIQFNFVRARSVLRKCIDEGIPTNIESVDASAWDESELRIIQQALNWPEIVQLAAAQYDPSVIANHGYELTKAYSRWYQDHSVLKEPNEAKCTARVALTQMYTRQIEAAMALLGIEMPERM